MKRILAIGIGAGNLEYVIIQAVNALNQVNVFFVMDKGGRRRNSSHYARRSSSGK
jgi:precorrin-6A synthase